MSLDLHGLQSFQHLPSSVNNCQRLTHSKYYKLLLCPRTFSLWRLFFCAFLSPTPKLTDNLTIDSAKGREFDSLQVSPAFLQPLSRGSIPFERRFSLDKSWKVAKAGEANQKPTLSRLFSDRIQEIQEHHYILYYTCIHLHNIRWIKFVSALRGVELLKVMRTNFRGTELTQPGLPRFSNLSEPFWPTRIWCSRLACCMYHHASIPSRINSMLIANLISL